MHFMGRRKGNTRMDASRGVCVQFVPVNDVTGWDATHELRSVGLNLTLRELYAGLLVEV
jgi:hypothetical protein